MTQPDRRAVVVLGRDLNTNAETLDDQLGPTNRARLLGAIERWHELAAEGSPPWFIASGKGLAGLDNPEMVEADKLGDFAILEGGIPEEFVKRERDSLDTWGNGIHTIIMMMKLGIKEAEYFTSSWTEERARLILGHTAGSNLIISVNGVPEVPTAHDLMGEKSGLVRASRIAENSIPGNIPSIQTAWNEEIKINSFEPLPQAA